MSSSKPASNLASNPERQHPLFSKLGVVMLTLFLISALILLQEIGIYIGSVLLADPSMATGLSIDSSTEPNIGSTTQDIIVSGSQNGTLLSLSFLFTLITMASLIFFIVLWRLKKHGKQARVSVKTFMALNLFDSKIALKVMGLFIIYTVLTEVGIYLFDTDPMDFLDVLYATAQPKWLLVVAIIVMAPIYEELMFRGIIWGAIDQHVDGRTGFWVTNIITSILFTAIHMQYNVYELSMLFVFALLLGYARASSGSILLPMLLHSLNNTLAMLLYVWTLKMK